VSYVPAPVAFVSGDGNDDDYPGASEPGYADDATASGGAARPELPRAQAEKAFDGSAPRRRPVVFEEDDDLDVPDFLK
jgi:cell division protein FtsZ